MDEQVIIKVRFIDSNTGLPLIGKEYYVHFYDKDIIKDDYLGESKLTPNGTAHLKFNLAGVSSWDSPGERHPDLYFILYKNKKPIYESKVIHNLDLTKVGTFDIVEGLSYDLGTFVI